MIGPNVCGSNVPVIWLNTVIRLYLLISRQLFFYQSEPEIKSTVVFDEGVYRYRPEPVDQSTTIFYQPELEIKSIHVDFDEVENRNRLESVDQSAAIFYQLEPLIKPTNAVPEEIAACWDLLIQSSLSSESFERLLSAASTRLTRSSVRGRKLDSKSLSSFLHFWSEVRGVATEPETSISPKGNVQTEWTKDDENFLVMEFQPNGQIYFSLWQEGFPTEGVKPPTRTYELLRTLDAMNENPLCWSDVT